jgi:hypothetical protein
VINRLITFYLINQEKKEFFQYFKHVTSFIW